MIKSIKKTSFIYPILFVFVISLIFTSCSKNGAYNKEIQTADSLFKKQQYQKAKIHFENAQKLKKDEVHPTNQIAKINTLLSLIENDNKYDSKIKEADAFFYNEEYQKAKAAYLDASEIKPTESYPKTKISEINTAPEKLKVDNSDSSKPFHVIAGSFEIEANAIAYRNKLNKKRIKSYMNQNDDGNGSGDVIKSTIIKNSIGNFLVSLKSFNSITKSYNYLYSLEENEFFNSEFWVYNVE